MTTNLFVTAVTNLRIYTNEASVWRSALASPRTPVTTLGRTGGVDLLSRELKGSERGDGLDAAAWQQPAVTTVGFARRRIRIIRAEMTAATFLALERGDREQSRDEDDVPCVAAARLEGRLVERPQRAAQSRLRAHEADVAPHQGSHLLHQSIAGGRLGIAASAVGR